jgi:hypothetical protein
MSSRHVLILYGVLDAGTALSVSSIEKSISLLGGRPQVLLLGIHVLVYSFNMGCSSRFGLSSSADSNNLYFI